MNGTICKSIMENCQNPYDSYGEICVGCNCCGRMGEDTMWQARYELAVRQLNELAEVLLSEHFQTNLQQKNICSNIKYWSENLKEILKHLDFDKEEGADNEQRKTD